MTAAERLEHGRLLDDEVGDTRDAYGSPLGHWTSSAAQRRSEQLRRSAFASALLALGLVAAVSTQSQRPRAASIWSPQALQGKDETVARRCGPIEDNVDFIYTGPWFNRTDHVTSPAACCDLCRSEEKCDGFTWVQDANLGTGDPGQCWLKSGKMTGKTSKSGVISGFKEARDSAAAGNSHHSDHDDDHSEKKHHKCADLGESCLENKCCRDPGHTCFTKNQYWAQCMTSCEKGPNPLDQVSPMPWECEALGDKAPGKPPSCATGAEDCSDSQCCTEGGMQCYAKNHSYAMCKARCQEGRDPSSPDWLPWTCKPLGPRTMGAADWVKEKCPAGGADCSKAQCCAEAGKRCYLQSEYWGECKETCEEGKASYPGGPEWACTPVGTRTPAFAKEVAAVQGKVAPWVAERCSDIGENCVKSQCCQAIDHQCFSKSEYWASCRTSCSMEPDPKDDNATWTCDELGPRSWGLPTKGFPGLYCISLFMPSRYEGPLLKAHLEANAGIFQCDGYDVFAAENSTLGTSKDGIEVKAILIPKITVGVSQDGTAGNAKLFMAVWDKVIASGRFRKYHWTIKADPDAVVIPWRIRDHLAPHHDLSVYVVNCNKFPDSPNFPMMYGAVEIFSYLAMVAYAEGSWKCGTKLPWGTWGEDYYMTHCLDFLQVGRINDFGVLGDQLCTGANCLDTYTGSFHPFKSKESWLKCWTQATVPTTTPAPVAGPPVAAAPGVQV